MPKKVKANGKTFTFEDDVTNEQIGVAIDEYFAGVKKKVVSQPTAPKKQLASPTQTQDTPTSSDTEKTQPPVESDGLGGPPKMKTFTGFTPEEQQTLQAKPVPKISKSAALIGKKLILQKELSTAKVTPENQEEILRKTDELAAVIKEQDLISNNRLSEIEQQFKIAKDDEAANIEADKRTNDALTNTGIWNNIKSASIDMYNAVLDQPALRAIGVDKLKADTDVLSVEKKEVLKDAAKNKIELSEEEVNQRAKQLYKNKQKDYIETDNINSFLDNLDENDKNLLKQSRRNLGEHLQDSNIKEEKVINAYEVVGNKKINEYKTIEQELLKYRNNNQPLPKDIYDTYVSLGNEIVGIGNSIQKRQSIINKNREDLGTVKQEFDLLKRRYGDIDNAVTNIGLGGTKILNGILGFTNYAAKFAGGAQGQIYSLAGQQVTDNINNYIADEENQLRKSVESIESPEGFVNYATDIIAKQIPNLIATSTGIGGLGVIGISSTGEKYTEMTREVLDGKSTYSPLQMAVAPALWGSAEVISEIPTLSILTKGGRVFDAIVKNEGNLIKKSVKEKAKEWAKDWSVDMGKEITGEEFTNFTQNFTNKYILGKKDVGLLDNTGTVLKDTFTLTNILKAAPHVAGAILKSHQDNSDLNVLDENSRKIIDFSKQLENTSLNDTERAVITKQIDKATAQNSKIIANTIEKVNNMPDDVYRKIIDLNNNIADIKIEAVAINDGNLPNKEELIKSLESDYRTAQTERNALIDAKYESPLQKSFNKLENNEKIKLKDQASRILMEEAKSKGLKNFEFNDQAITDKAVELFKQTVSEVAPTEKTPAEVISPEPKQIEVTGPKIESPIELKEGEELVDTAKDKKGNTYTYVSETSEKDGLKITKFKFNRSDKSTEHRNDTGVDTNKVLDKYGFEIAEDEIPEGAEITKIYEIRDGLFKGERSVGATVLFKDPETGGTFKGEVQLTPKAEAKPTPTEVISPETSSNYANLTENKDGDFVFFHVGGKGYEKVKKSTGGTTATSKEEASALSKVGGVAMYYTKPGDTETMVNGEAKYAVTIPKEKVYDANTDPKNYAEEAKTRHEEENPGKAFDANSKLAYITKIAGENGFDMVVSEWMGKTRAQTTTELTPTDVQLKEGNKIAKPFEEEYVDNSAKGLKSIVPEPKEAKLNAVYDEINNIRNKQNKYDELYKLSSKDLTNVPQEETTKLIEESDLPKEVKDKYAEALAYESEKRRTVNIVGKTVKVKNAPEGHHLNIGLLEGRTQNVMSAKDVLSKLPKDIKVISHSEIKGTEPSISVEISRPLTASEMSNFLDDTKQQAIAQLSDKKGVLYDVKRGSTEGWGDFNPSLFFTQDGKNLAEVKEEVVATNDTEAFRDKIKDIPESGKVSKYLSGETIEKVEGEAPRNAQEIDVMPLIEAGIHGKETVAMAKEVYGDKYIEKTLEFLDTAKLKAHEKALLYVSLENEMFDLVKTDPSLKKLQDLVRAKSQQFLRESSLAINMGRLRAIMKDGFNYESITDGFLSTDQLVGKKEVEKAIQSDANAIQNEYEGMISESDLEQLILSGVEKQINEIYKKLPTARRVKADKAIAALERIQKKLKGKAYDATIGLPIALIDSGITVIKNSIKAGVNIADAIELGINHIKEKYGKDWANEGVFRDDMTQGFKSEGVSEKEMKAKELSDKDIVNQALIEAGFGKEITVKKEKRKVLDWKKLAGEEGSVDKLRENVEKIIGKEAAKELEDEYNNLRASIIEKSLNELERRNIPRKKVNLKTSAKKLAEIYNYGAFEKESDTYDQVMNTVLGMNELDQKSFNEAKKLAKSLAELFSRKYSEGNPISQESLKHGERVINKKIERLLSSVAWSESNGLYKAVTIAKEFIGAAQRNALVSVGQAIENTMSGYVSRIYNKIGFSIDNVDTKSLKESRNKLARMTFKDIVLGGGLEFGDVTSPFITKSKTMDLIQNASDSRLYHALTSTALGKPFLEAADSMHKSALTAKFFQYNLIKILRKKGYSKTEAKNYVSEQLTGQSFDKALVDSKEIIDEINKNAGKKVIPDSEESIYRFANDLINESLIQGEKINIDEIRAAMKAAETVAGFELGHEPNNIISKPLNLFNSWIQTRIDKAVKDKKWNDAAALTIASILSGNILNPYVGGGMNWAFIGMQKVGIPTPATIYWNIKARSNKLDVSSEQGMKNLEQSLKYQLLAKNATTRVVIGSAISLAAFALVKSTGSDDDLYKWLKKNAWANKYFTKVSPPVVQYMVAEKNKKISEFFGKQLNLKVDAFDEGKKIKQAIDNISSGKTQKALGGAGQLVGSRLSTPIVPWRLVRDVSDIYRGLNGLPAIKHEFKASGFASGYFQGGMVEQLGLRPEDVKDVSGGRQSSGSRSASGNRESSGTRTQSGSR